MPQWESNRLLRTYFIPTLATAILVCYPSLFFAQSISNVTVSKKPGTNPQTTDFTLRISGKDFGSDKSKVSVVVTPKEGHSAVCPAHRYRHLPGR